MTTNKQEITSTYGIWKVSASQDGPSTQLGIWEGHIDEIALHLGNHHGYYLDFTPVEIKRPGEPTSARVNVNLFSLVGKFHDPREELKQRVQRLFNGRPVAIKDGDYTDSAIVNPNAETEKQRTAELRRQAYQALSPEQRRAMGLPATVEEFEKSVALFSSN